MFLATGQTQKGAAQIQNAAKAALTAGRRLDRRHACADAAPCALRPADLYLHLDLDLDLYLNLVCRLATATK